MLERFVNGLSKRSLDAVALAVFSILLVLIVYAELVLR